eukprot:266228-Chlamydomonas_euryale.AAC.1
MDRALSSGHGHSPSSIVIGVAGRMTCVGGSLPKVRGDSWYSFEKGRMRASYVLFACLRSFEPQGSLAVLRTFSSNASLTETCAHYVDGPGGEGVVVVHGAGMAPSFMAF